MLVLSKKTLQWKIILCLSAAAMLWGASQAATADAARKDNLPAAQSGSPSAGKAHNLAAARQALYEQMSAATGIPWFRFAAIDQYERTIAKKKANAEASGSSRITGFNIPAPVWAGPLNPNQEDTSPDSIRFFGGMGYDGSGDGVADPSNDADLLYSMARHLQKYGNSPSDFSIGVWEYYHNGRAAQRVAEFAKLYEHFGRLDLSGSAFPLPIGNSYAYRSTWGTGRSWGGARIHEGTDLFAPQGMPVRSTCYGIIETKGWNRYGGWRIGIRDIENRYHYYAHLSGYDKSVTRGDIVTPGQIIGWVGSSGYGSPGTQGKFPPHLHYGIYRDRGITEWAFDPYPLLKQWENQEYRALRNNKKSK